MLSAAALGADAVLPVEIADRHSRNASLTLAFAQPGDTLLYLLLPLDHEVFGVSLAETGLLLAANRLVRIAGYGWVARYYAIHGPRAACLLAVAGSALATLGYALSSGLIALVVARLLWAIQDTVIGAGSRLDNLVQIGHNVRLGRCCVIVAQVGISGSTELEDFVQVGGQAAMAGHLHIGHGAQIGAQAGVISDVPAAAILLGSPAQPRVKFFRQVATLKRMVRRPPPRS